MGEDYTQIYVDGQWILPNSELLYTIRGAADEVVGSVPDCNETDVKSAIDASEKAFNSWFLTKKNDRLRYLTEINDAATNLLEAKFPYKSSRLKGLKPSAITIIGTPNQSIEEIMELAGPAMVKGFTITINPSNVAYLDAFKLAKIVNQSKLPPGVFNVISGALARDFIDFKYPTLSYVAKSKRAKAVDPNKGRPILNVKAFHNRIAYTEAAAFIKKGHGNPLSPSDVWETPEEFTSDYVWKMFEPHWQLEKSKPKPSLLKAVLRTLGPRWSFAIMFQAIFAVLSFANPIVLPYLIEYIQDPSQPLYIGFVYVAIIVVCGYIGSFMYYKGLYMSATVGLQLRILCIQLVYRKILVLGSTRSANSGQIVNLVANDAQFMADTIMPFTSGLVAPFQVAIAIGLLAIHIGPYCLIALAVVVVMFSVSFKLGQRFKGYRFAIQKFADQRLKLTNELIQGIRIVKFYAWETPFLNNILKARVVELNQVRKLGILRAVLILINSNTNTFIVALIFVFYAIVGKNQLTPPIAFAVLALMNVIKQPFFLLSFTVTLFQQYNVTIGRIMDFVMKPEVNSNRSLAKEVEISTFNLNPNNVVTIQQADFSWSNDPESLTLARVILEAGKGTLTCVVGAVGSGKSTLALAILGEVPMIRGYRDLKASAVSYVAQEAWIFNATLKENILYGLPYDSEKYHQVLHAAALGPDLQQLPDGDRTEIGERGINLSGGQKQRVSIARALYSDNEVFVMDDPFSAVDSHVGKHLFEEAVQKYLKGKTVILITNQLQNIPFANQVAIIKAGQLEDLGNYQDLMQRSETLQAMMKDFGAIEIKKKTPATDTRSKFKPAKSKVAIVIDRPKRDENKESGLVSWRIYQYYARSGKYSLLFVIVGCYSLFTTANVLSSWWLAEFTQGSYTNLGTGGFIGIYVMLTVVVAIFTFFSYFTFAFFSAEASRSLHEFIIKKVVRAPTGFFDVTPVGRIINRFAKELSSIDALLPIQMAQMFNSVFTILGVFAAIAFASPYLLLAVLVLIIFYLRFQVFYRHTSVELQRMEALSRAPIYSHLSETITGVATIRAYGKEDQFIRNISKKVDLNTSSLYGLRFCASWFGLVLDLAGGTLTLVVLLVIVLLRNYSPGSLQAGFAGIAITYLAGLTFILSNLNLQTVETETRMNSVERIKEYEKIPEELPYINESCRPPADWPTEGKLTFTDYSLAYRKSEKVLQNISCEISPKEKIGIVGRTGAGKSSLMIALFRMVEPCEGTIFIDGIDITSIGLFDLRSKLSIIPQEPTLFTGSVRYNLDPFNESNDKDIWTALEMVRLHNAISALPNKLDEIVSEGGGNFSVGERQLLCMARALLRKSKILLMDEATASVDNATDTMIQKMVRENFRDVTVLTIAHRLNTIMDSSRAMVLDRGRIAEFDRPSELLAMDDGLFNSMVNATGPAVSTYLRKVARGEMDVLAALTTLNESKQNEAESEEEAIEEASYEHEMYEFEQSDVEVAASDSKVRFDDRQDEQ